jgi:hypothetical protein
MKLVFRPMKSSDFGIYKCIAKNQVGASEEIIKIYREFSKLNFSMGPSINYCSILIAAKSKIADSNNYHQSSYLGAFIVKNGKLSKFEK